MRKDLSKIIDDEPADRPLKAVTMQDLIELPFSNRGDMAGDISRSTEWCDPDRLPTDREFMANAYEILLGRPPESNDIVLAGLEHAPTTIVRSILSSPEFAQTVVKPILDGDPLPANRWDWSLTTRHRYWAIDRLPLKPESYQAIERATNWRDFLSTLLADKRLGDLREARDIWSGAPNGPVVNPSQSTDGGVVHDINPVTTYVALNVLRMMRPHTLVGADKVRTGRFFDGGYVMIDRFDGVEAAYSLGINDDVSWDLDMARRNIPVFQYDHTIDGLPIHHPLFHWEPKCISGIADPDAGVETLENLISKNGHKFSKDLILKCDIEGSEWLLLEKTPNKILGQFRQIVIEIHNMSFLCEEAHAENVRKAISNLTASHKVVHVHANNFAPFTVVGGLPIPAVLELTLMRADQGEYTKSKEIFPTALDMPCHSHSADLYLGQFSFD